MHFYDEKLIFDVCGKTTLKNALGSTAPALKTSFLDLPPKTES